MIITQAQLKEVLHYNPNTGLFEWIDRLSNRVKINDVAGTLSNGYITIQVFSKLYQAHRLAWLYMTGSWPKEHIDHINHIRDDNRWINIRGATNSENQKNKTKRKDNKSGVTGVCWDKQRQKWSSELKVDGVKVHLGRNTDKFEAICARKSADNKYGFHENHGRN